MRVLVLTKIFPNSLEPLSSPFNRQQFEALSALCELKILATIPWFPGAGLVSKWSSAGRLRHVPKEEQLFGMQIAHPRYLFIPRIAPGLSGPLYVASLMKDVLPLRGQVDVVLGSFAYPDGYAAIRLAEMIGAPSVVKLHGSDINVIAKLPGPAKRLRSALPRAARIAAVSRALADRAVELGADRARVDVVQNGVDKALFRPLSRAEARAELGLDADRRSIVYVGRLEKTKGVEDLVQAFEALRRRRNDVELSLVGDGGARAFCDAAAARLGGALRLPGARPLAEVPRWIAASDVVTLPSWNEGMPNAVVEALACGRRVVATSVGGVPDLIRSPALGELVPPRDVPALELALDRALDTPYDADDVVRRGDTRSWAESARCLLEVLDRAVEAHTQLEVAPC